MGTTTNKSAKLITANIINKELSNNNNKNKQQQQPRTSVVSQIQENNNPFITSFNTHGECITIAFGNTFDIFTSFFESLYNDHSLHKQPQYEYFKYFNEHSSQRNVYIPRGFAYEIPSTQSNIYTNSFLYKTNPLPKISFTSQTHNENVSFINSYLNTTTIRDLYEQLRKETEKCDNLHQLHFISDIFNGYAMGTLCSLLASIRNDYTSTLKLTHLKYFDTFSHRAFSKRKNYITSIAHLYTHCNLINLFNTLKGGEVINNLTVGDRIKEYSSKYNMNNLISSILFNSKTKFVYSNGMSINEHITNDNCKLIFEDCKEGRYHMEYFPQYTSVCIYKGNKYYNESKREIFKHELKQIIKKQSTYHYNYDNNNNKHLHSFIHINKCLFNDFVSHTHHSNMFKDMTEEYYFDFIQEYNLTHFNGDEREMREDVIYKTNEIINNYNEVKKCLK